MIHRTDLISDYIDGILSDSEMRFVKEQIEKDKDWEKEYEALNEFNQMMVSHNLMSPSETLLQSTMERITVVQEITTNESVVLAFLVKHNFLLICFSAFIALTFSVKYSSSFLGLLSDPLVASLESHVFVYSNSIIISILSGLFIAIYFMKKRITLRW